jgi:hypothetical protein
MFGALKRLLLRGATRRDDGWGDPSAGSEFKEALEKLARRAWTNQPPASSSHFLFVPERLIIRDEDVLNAALAALYGHARRWASGLEIPYHIPRLRISRGSRNAGQFEIDGEGWLAIDLSAEFLDLPKALWLILAHEVCHHILAQSGLTDNYDSSRNERLTDIAMFVCGFGGLAKAGQTFIRRTDSGYLKTHLGYLKPAEYAYAYHWVIAARCNNRLAGMSGVTAVHSQLAAGFVVVDAAASFLERLKARVPDSATRQRLLNYYRGKYPTEPNDEIYERIIDSYERDRR